jgi:hypothetical protein
VLAVAAASIENPTEVTLETVDQSGKASGIDEVKVGRISELTNRNLELIERV